MKTLSLFLAAVLVLAGVVEADLSWQCINPYPACEPLWESDPCTYPAFPMPCPQWLGILALSEEDVDTLRQDPSPTMQAVIAERDQFVSEYELR